jgi:hypothetical protein
LGKKPLLLLGAVLLLAVFSFPLRPAFAATVIVPISITVAEAGAPSFTWTIGGPCLPSPSSGSTGGTVTVTMTASCAYTINTPTPDGATVRDRLTSGASYVTSLAETSCASGTCSTVSDTAHVQDLLTIGANCNGAVLSVASPTSDKWYNYGTSLTVTCNGIWGRASGTGTRAISWNWDGGASTSVATTLTFTSSLQSMTNGHTLNVNTVTQNQLTLDARAIAALFFVTNPTITATSTGTTRGPR